MMDEDRVAKFTIGDSFESRLTRRAAERRDLSRCREIVELSGRGEIENLGERAVGLGIDATNRRIDATRSQSEGCVVGAALLLDGGEHRIPERDETARRQLPSQRIGVMKVLECTRSGEFDARLLPGFSGNGELDLSSTDGHQHAERAQE